MDWFAMTEKEWDRAVKKISKTGFTLLKKLSLMTFNHS
ncbi:hypothetical protein Sta7437_2261 [Stanieria cyanosphaera PCC 7437]|uniref:Uncharacterized protein n=1 Tax=Stanieria cyanosphaera (strain ATCC 29371 / PCC 7437) TaxID=111780 RepID=K9XT75_STAC7|nr:hypothetical protein Sta7437_2261 [Stanieria cyanosphaera PCC 7437]